MNCGLCEAEQQIDRWYMPAVATHSSGAVQQLKQQLEWHLGNMQIHPTWVCPSKMPMVPVSWSYVQQLGSAAADATCWAAP